MPESLIIHPILALTDNYIWAITNPILKTMILVDPGEASVCVDFQQRQQFQLQAIFITHHHWDHTNGIAELSKTHSIPVYGPAQEEIKGVTAIVAEHDTIEIAGFPQFSILAIPGHTRGHIAYYTKGHVFCGDTLFSAGCGRLFEGTPAQMFASLQTLAHLSGDTLLYCAHEYTQRNLTFAQRIEPENSAIAQRLLAVEQLRHQTLPTLPVSLANEKRINPFLRCHEPAVIAAASRYAGVCLTEPVDVFAALRAWKDKF